MNKVISGGQTGADLGGLIAGKLYGFETGGWMPYGFRNHNGYQPELEDLFGVQQHSDPGYKQRTWANIEDSDGTIRIAQNFGSAGEKCTLNGIKKFGKPYVDIHVDKVGTIDPTDISNILTFILFNKISTLNVAGNSDKTWKGMQSFTVLLLSIAFTSMGYVRTPLPHKYSHLATGRSY